MNNAKVPLGILQRISEFLADLPEDQLTDLAEGRARLAYVPVGASEPAPSGKTTRSRGAPTRHQFTPSPATTELLQRFETLGSRDEATAALAPLGKADLVDIAKALSVPGAGKLNMPRLRQEIVEATVGRRIDSIATRGFDGARP
jgi:hypothetical protein